jgi:hypothetical protein
MMVATPERVKQVRQFLWAAEVGYSQEKVQEM